MLSDWQSYNAGCEKRAASITALFMALVNNGGLNAFLTSTYDLDTEEVLESLVSVGALKAAQQLREVLQGLNVPLGVSSQSKRWDALDLHWNDSLDQFETLSTDADDELQAVLERHVSEHQQFYFALGQWQQEA